MKAAWLFTILFLACGSVHSQSLRVLPVQVPGDQALPAAIQFFCTEKYSRNACQNDISRLRQTLRRYPLEGLGHWSFVLASLEEWDATVSRLHLPPESPVFSSLHAGMTVIAQTLFSGPADRRAELLKLFGAPSEQLLNVAISHELGHALCREVDEARAAIYGEQVRAGRFPTCGRHETPPSIVAYDASLTTLSVESFLQTQNQVPGTKSVPVGSPEHFRDNRH